MAGRRRTVKGRLHGLGWWLAGIALLVGLLFWFAIHWRPSVESYPVQGVDVSEIQGAIAWPTVAAAGVRFAYIKATEGADIRDPRFTENWTGTAKAGVTHGAYHRYSLCRLASDQATNYISTVPRDADALPAAIQLDFEGDCKERPARSVIISEIEGFAALVEAHTGKPIVLYLTQDFEELYQVTHATDRQIWLRSAAFPPNFGAHAWTMWQANRIRQVPGIAGPTHWNVIRP